ncbi:MAG: molybdopterin-dependent oxidoreductase [Myxococcota bacterium]
MAEHRYQTCMLCEAMCGLEVELASDGSVAKVRGDEADPFSRGHICPKALAIEDIRNDPDRVTQPLRRGPRGFEPVSWREAIEEATSRIAELQGRFGPHAVGLYLGNPTVHSVGALLGGIAFASALKGRSTFSATSADQLPHMLAALQMFGNQALMPVPDLDRTRFWLIVGGNPVASNGSIMTAPGVSDRIKAIRARGGTVVVVDPRRTETAELASTHLAIQPGTDALFLLALVHVIVHEKRMRPGRLEAMTVGLDELPALSAPFTPEAVAPHVDLPAETIRALARDFSANEAAVAYGRIGLCTQMTGGTAAWLIYLLNVITGNLDRVGGAMFTTPAIDLAELARRVGRQGSFNKFKTRVRGLPEFGGEQPVAALAEEMETPGDKQIRALITYAGNPVLSTPNGSRLERAIEKLDFVLSFDIYKNETTRHAHLILPTSFGFERDHFDLALNALAVRNTVKFAPAMVTPRGDVREDFELLLDFGATLAAKRDGAKGKAHALTLRAMRKVGLRRTLDLLLRLGPHRLSLAELLRTPHGKDLGALEPRLPQVLATPDRRIQAVPAIFKADLPRVQAMLSAPRPSGLVLIGRRLLRSNNSWMHNSDRLTKGKPPCTLLIHPEDAAQRGILSGAPVTLRSERGVVITTAEVSEVMKRGVVSLPHGYGHDRPGTELRIASARPGASMNDVTDERAVDPLSATAVLNGVSVEVEARAAVDANPSELRA